MAVFPRLRDVFGVPVDQIDVAAIERAIQRRAPESEQLDWKRDPYKRGSSDEIAKDIAGMANNAGGVVILGVEEDEHSRATAATPFADSVDALIGMVSEARQRRIRPFIPDLTVTAIDAGSGNHFMVIVVGRSYDAPHAVMPESPTATTLAFPMRQMTTTAWLKEDQVAAMYRNRFAAHADVAASVDALMDEHSRGRWSPQHWVSIAVAPTVPGTRAPGVSARTAEVGFALSWAANCDIPGSNFHLGLNGLERQVRPAIGQTVIWFSGAALRLGHDGSAHVTQSITKLDPHSDVDMRTPLSHAGGRNGVWGSTDEVEWALFTALSYAVDHAINTGASGDLEVRAKPEIGTPAGAESSPLGGLASCNRHGTYPATHGVPDLADMLQKTTIASATVGISDGANHRTTATAAYLLATDILAEFGIDEPRLFAYDGWVTVEHFGPRLRNDGAPAWAAEHVNIDTASNVASR
ncbi:helix-turn-helix domain-containing protein [Antrihabitans spumae]|uniref:Helix-turn-helix domain-containing protein n=1 Tax=Antrihabitans spumae TaxID=3373370 RepID=A0ABW7KU91_9NOCA